MMKYIYIMRILFIFFLLSISIKGFSQGWKLKTAYRSDSCVKCEIGRHTHRHIINYSIWQDSVHKTITFAYATTLNGVTTKDTTIYEYGRVEVYPDAPEKDCIYYRTRGEGNVVYYPGKTP